jgi:hypothetical protein
MIKISLLLTNILCICALAACSSQPVDEHFTNDEFTTSNQELIDKETAEPNFPPLQPSRSTQDRLVQDNKPIVQSPSSQDRKNDDTAKKVEENSTVLSDNVLENDRFFIDTPEVLPTLGDQSSEHENEYRPKTLDHTTAKEDQHRETPPSPAQTAQPKKPDTKKDTSNKVQSDLNKHSNEGKETNKQSNTKKQLKGGLEVKKEKGLSTESIHQTVKKNALDKNSKQNLSKDSEVNFNKGEHEQNLKDKANYLNINDHDEGHNEKHTGHLDDHSHTGGEDTHTHELKTKKKRHWNMQRMVKPK